MMMKVPLPSEEEDDEEDAADEAEETVCWIKVDAEEDTEERFEGVGETFVFEDDGARDEFLFSVPMEVLKLLWFVRVLPETGV